MTTHGNSRNDGYRARPQSIAPAPVSKRQSCTKCGKHKSCGQFPINSSVCISCAPQGKSFRRGDLP